MPSNVVRYERLMHKTLVICGRVVAVVGPLLLVRTAAFY